MPDFDVVIVGAGLVGASLAASLCGSGLRLAVVEPAAPRVAREDSWDSRIYAVSPGSVAYLEGSRRVAKARRCAHRSPCWICMCAATTAPRVSISAASKSGTPRLLGSWKDLGLQDALWRTLVADDEIELRCPCLVCVDHLAGRPGGACPQGRRAPVHQARRRGRRCRFLGTQAGAESPLRSTRTANSAWSPILPVRLSHGGVARQWFRR